MHILLLRVSLQLSLDLTWNVKLMKDIFTDMEELVGSYVVTQPKIK